MDWIKSYRRKIIVSLAAGVVFVLLIFLTPTWVQVSVFCLLGVYLLLVELGWQAICRARSVRSWLLVSALAVSILLGIEGAVRLVDSASGEWRIFAVACIVTATDVGAQVIGQRFGKAGTFLPSMSPNKTLHGVVGGIGIGLIAALMAIPGLMLLDASPKWILLTLLPFLAVAGDLLESVVKRSLGIKDFANFIPQTGGVLDRVDSWLPTLAFAGWFLV